MKNHRTLWAIAVGATALALGVFAVRQGLGGSPERPRHTRSERDRMVGDLIGRLERDPRVRLATTQALVETVSNFCVEPELASAETWYAQGLRAYYGESDAEAARAAFARAAQLRPEWAWPVNGLAIVEFDQGRRAAAERYFARALDLEPDWSRPHSDLAILYRRAGELGAAFDEAQRALEIEPNHPVNQFNYGVILDELGRHAEARELYLRVLKLAPDLPQAAYNLACSYAREGDAARASSYLARAIAGEPVFAEEALEDPDFGPIREDAGFQRLTLEAIQTR